MTYKGYTIYRELSGWQRQRVNPDGSIAEVLEFIEDDGQTFQVHDRDDVWRGEEFTLEDAKQVIDTLACDSTRKSCE